MSNSLLSLRKRWETLLLLILTATLIALGVIAYTSRQQSVVIAEEQAQIDASLLRRWFEQERALGNLRVARLANRLAPGAELATLLADAGLDAPSTYAAWLNADGSARAEVNAEARRGNFSELPMLRAIGSLGAASDFVYGDGQAALLSLAAVDEAQGGGVLAVQSPLDEAALAQMTGRPVLFLSYAEQAAVASSDPELLAAPPRFDSTFLREVATGQQARSAVANSARGNVVAGVTALPDFANLSFSGYLALVEPTQDAARLIPLWRYIGLIVVAALILIAGGWLLQRQFRAYMNSYQGTTLAQRRGRKLRMGALFLLFVLPVLLTGGYMLWHTTEVTRELNQRTARIADDVIIASVQELATQVARFVDDPLAAGVANLAEGSTVDEWARDYQQHSQLGFVVVEQAGETTTQAITDLPTDAGEALAALEPSQSALLFVNGDGLLAAKQQIDAQTTVSAGYPVSSWLIPFTDGTSTEVTLLRGDEIAFSSLNGGQRTAFSESPRIMQAVQQASGEPFREVIGWDETTLVAAPLNLNGANVVDEAGGRIAISQGNTAYANPTTTYQGQGAGVLAVLLLVVAVCVLAIFAQDQPLKLNRTVVGYLFLLPALIWLVWWQLGPALYTIYLSTHKWSVLDPTRPFVGLHNFRLVFADERFWNAMINTVVYLIQIPIGMAISLALALVLNQKLRGIRLLRTIYYIPAVTSLVVVALMWRWIYNKDFGILNYLLGLVNLGPYGWLQSVQLALPSIMIMAVWLGLGARMLLFLAGLQSISEDYYDAASVDGATGWSRFRFITFPLLMPTTFFVLITSVIGSFQVFTPVYVLTGGGPAGATDVAVHRIYFEAWQNLRFGYASAETVVLFVCLFALTILQFRYFGERVDYVR